MKKLVLALSCIVASMILTQLALAQVPGCQLLNWTQLGQSSPIMGDLQVVDRPGLTPVAAHMGPLYRPSPLLPDRRDLIMIDSANINVPVTIVLPILGIELKSLSYDSGSDTFFAVIRDNQAIETLYLTQLSRNFTHLRSQPIFTSTSGLVGIIRSNDQNILSFVDGSYTPTASPSISSYQNQLYACSIMHPLPGLPRCGSTAPATLYSETGTYAVAPLYDIPGIKNASVMHDGVAPVAFLSVRSLSLINSSLLRVRQGQVTNLKTNNLSGPQFYHESLWLNSGLNQNMLTYVDLTPSPSNPSPWNTIHILNTHTGGVTSLTALNPAAVVNTSANRLTSRRSEVRPHFIYSAENKLQFVNAASGLHIEVLPFSAAPQLNALVEGSGMDGTMVAQKVNIQGVPFLAFSQCQ